MSGITPRASTLAAVQLSISTELTIIGVGGTNGVGGMNGVGGTNVSLPWLQKKSSGLTGL